MIIMSYLPMETFVLWYGNFHFVLAKNNPLITIFIFVCAGEENGTNNVNDSAFTPAVLTGMSKFT